MSTFQKSFATKTKNSMISIEFFIIATILIMYILYEQNN